MVLHLDRRCGRSTAATCCSPPRLEAASATRRSRASRRSSRTPRRTRTSATGRSRSARARRSTAAISPASCSSARARSTSRRSSGARSPSAPRVAGTARCTPFSGVEALDVRSLDERPLPLQVDGDYIGEVHEAAFGCPAAARRVAPVLVVRREPITARRAQRARSPALAAVRAESRGRAAAAGVPALHRAAPPAPRRPALPDLPGRQPVEPARRPAAGGAELGAAHREHRARRPGPPGLRDRSTTAHRTGSRTRSSRTARAGCRSASSTPTNPTAGRYPLPRGRPDRGRPQLERRPPRDRRRPRHVQRLRAVRRLPARWRPALDAPARARSSTCAPTTCAPPAGPRPTPPGCRSCPASRATTRSRAGAIDHALRFTAPCTAPRVRLPRAPLGLHLQRPRRCPPMGLRVRLKASVDISRLPYQARIVAQALKTLRDDPRRQRLAAGTSRARPTHTGTTTSCISSTSSPGSDFEVVDTSSLPHPGIPGAQARRQSARPGRARRPSAAADRARIARADRAAAGAECEDRARRSGVEVVAPVVRVAARGRSTSAQTARPVTDRDGARVRRRAPARHRGARARRCSASRADAAHAAAGARARRTPRARSRSTSTAEPVLPAPRRPDAGVGEPAAGAAPRPVARYRARPRRRLAVAGGARRHVRPVRGDPLRARRCAPTTAARDRAADPFGVRLGGVGPGGRERLHYPDLLLARARRARGRGRARAVAARARTRREKILGGYAADARIDAVVYLVSTGASALARRRHAPGARDLLARPRAARASLRRARPACRAPRGPRAAHCAGPGGGGAAGDRRRPSASTARRSPVLDRARARSCCSRCRPAWAPSRWRRRSRSRSRSVAGRARGRRPPHRAIRARLRAILLGADGRGPAGRSLDRGAAVRPRADPRRERRRQVDDAARDPHRADPPRAAGDRDRHEGLARRSRASSRARRAAAGRPFRLWTPDGPGHWNPLAHGNATELKDKLIATERFTEPHYQRAAERYVQTALQVLHEAHAGAAADARRGRQR